MSPLRWFVLLLLAACLLPAVLLTGCAPADDLDASLDDITDHYRFDLAGWEAGALAGEAVLACFGQTQSDGTACVREYFDNLARLDALAGEIAAIAEGRQSGDADSLRVEYEEIETANARLALTVERTLEAQLREALTEQGIVNPFGGEGPAFPPVSFHLGPPPHLLVVSPRDRIENLRRVNLLPEMTVAEREEIEAEVEALGYSALVTSLGGIATYPSFVADSADLRYTINTAAEEWLHQYLAFTPLGLGYVLDLSGLRRDNDVITMNETVAGIVSEEIGAIVYDRYYAGAAPETYEAPADGFDFNAAMRETRLAVDAYLAAGRIEEAETYMEARRLYINANGYYIRKLNQAYFAFHGSYADSPTSVDPIGDAFRQLRGQSESLRAFLDSAAAMTSPADLDAALD